MDKNLVPDLESFTPQEEKDKYLFLTELLITSNVWLATERSGLPKHFYSKWYLKDQMFRNAARVFLTQPQYLNDFAESVLIKKILEEEDMSAIKFWLKHKHPAYKDGDTAYHTRDIAAAIDDESAKMDSIIEQVKTKPSTKSPYKAKLGVTL